MILADIGNSYAHILIDDKIEHLKIDSAIAKFKDAKVFYICVNRRVEDRLKSLREWIDISSYLSMKGFYKGMGVDRKALCLSNGDGLYIDAGSAITIDLVKSGEYIGGTILPGIGKLQECYSSISPALDKKVDFEEIKLSRETSKQIGYGIIMPIISLISNIREDMSIYICGGDGKLLSRFIDDSIYDERLLFRGMEKAVERNFNSGD